MVAKHKRSGTALSLPGGIAAGLAVSILVAVICCGVLAYLILNEKMDEGSVGYGAMVILVMSSGLGTWVATKCIKSRQLFVCGLFACCYFLTLLSVNALFFGGQYQGMGVTAGMIMAGTSCSFLILIAGNKSRKSLPKFRSYR